MSHSELMTGRPSVTNAIRIRPRIPDEGVQWNAEIGELEKKDLGQVRERSA